MKKIQNIVGIVDWLGAVHSEHTGDAIRHHADFWPATHCQWRWDSSQGIWWITAEHKPNDEQLESIQNHLSKKYGIDC